MTDEPVLTTTPAPARCKYNSMTSILRNCERTFMAKHTGEQSWYRLLFRKVEIRMADACCLYFHEHFVILELVFDVDFCQLEWSSWFLDNQSLGNHCV